MSVCRPSWARIWLGTVEQPTKALPSGATTQEPAWQWAVLAAFWKEDGALEVASTLKYAHVRSEDAVRIPVTAKALAGTPGIEALTAAGSDAVEHEPALVDVDVEDWLLPPQAASPKTLTRLIATTGEQVFMGFGNPSPHAESRKRHLRW